MNQSIGSHSASEEPLYNIGVVSRMTGISVATLRAWERRYGFPTSGRTSGGHRLYSERDMMRLRWVRSQIDGGMQTAQAIDLLRHREAEERVGATPPRDAGPALAGPVLPVTVPSGNGTGLETYKERLEESLLRYDTQAADQVLGQVLLSHSLDDLIFQVLQPAFADIGAAWQEQRINVAMEHLTTHYLRHRLLMWMLSGPQPFPVHPVILACAPGELHEGSLLIMGALLRRRRWPVAYLGQTVPLADLAALVRDMQPPAVVLVAMTEEPAGRLADWPLYMPEAHQNGHPPVLYGGHIFTEQPEWRSRVPGEFLGASLADGIARLEDLLMHTAV